MPDLIILVKIGNVVNQINRVTIIFSGVHDKKVSPKQGGIA
jgi:hypothetical protein